VKSENSHIRVCPIRGGGQSKKGFESLIRDARSGGEKSRSSDVCTQKGHMKRTSVGGWKIWKCKLL